MSNKMGLDSKGRMRIKLILPLPPTDNKIYFNLPRGGRELTSEARGYKNKVREVVAAVAATCSLSFRKNIEHELVIRVYLSHVENSGFGKEKTLERYKKVDSSNRTKLVTDAVAAAIGIDDKHIFKTIILKRSDPDNPRIEVIWREQEKRDCQSKG